MKLSALVGTTILGMPLLLGGNAHADTLLPDLTINDPCATFNVPVEGTTFTKVAYGEAIKFPGLEGTVTPEFDPSADGTMTLNFQVSVHGTGEGQTSHIQYRLNANARFLGKAQLTSTNVSFQGRFRLDARLIGQGNAATATQIAQGAQDNAVMHVYVNVVYDGASASLTVSPADVSLECSASPWNNLMTNADATTKKSEVGRGFGDVWNKYAWSMKDFNGGLVVGTKNAYYNYGVVSALAEPDNAINPYCEQILGLLPTIYRYLGCAELFAGSSDGKTEDTVGTNTRFAEIWRFNYTKKNWTRVNDQAPAGATPWTNPGFHGQGFRIMQKHGSKLYAGSDYGSFITGVQLGTGPTQANPSATWDFPGSRVMVSSNGVNWSEISTCQPGAAQPSPCNAALNSTMPITGTNVSFRAMASYTANGTSKLYVGTWNYTGGELWSYTANGTNTGTWAAIAKFAGPDDPTNPVNDLIKGICATPLWSGKCITTAYSAGVLELATYGDKLVMGLAYPAGNHYLWQYGGSGQVSEVPDTPPVASTTYGVIKLFVTSKNVLYVGFVDLTKGFTLLKHDAANGWVTVTNTGFQNDQNAYPWSMTEIGGRVFVGTFNQDFFSQVPRGSSELWYSDDGLNWTQQALPVNWGLWNYGIRNMVVGNKGTQVFLGTASNMIAPDVLYPQNGAVAWPDGSTALSPGAEVWKIRSNALRK